MSGLEQWLDPEERVKRLNARIAELEQLVRAYKKRDGELDPSPAVTDDQIGLVDAALEQCDAAYHGPTRKAWRAIRAALQQEGEE